MDLIHPSSFDYLDVELQCVKCGHVAKDPIAAELQTKISLQPATRRIKIGDVLVGKETPEKASYFRGNMEYDPRAFTCVEDWDCEKCGPLKWLQFAVSDGKLQQVRAVHLTDEILRTSDLLALSVVQTIPLEWLREKSINVRKLFESDRDQFIRMVLENSQ